VLNWESRVNVWKDLGSVVLVRRLWYLNASVSFHFGSNMACRYIRYIYVYVCIDAFHTICHGVLRNHCSTHSIISRDSVKCVIVIFFTQYTSLLFSEILWINLWILCNFLLVLDTIVKCVSMIFHLEESR